MRWEVVARSPKRRSASRTASAKPAPPGTTSSGWRSPSSPRTVHSARSASSPASRPSPPPTLTTVSTARAGASPAAPPAPRRARPRRPSRPTARRIRDRSLQARGDLAPQEGAGADRDDRRVGRQRPLHAARRVLEPAQLLAVQEGRDRVDLARVELLGIGAHQPGDALTRERERRRAAVGRGTVVRLRRQVAEDEMDVGADREALGRHRAATAADRHARRDRREVGAQHAGVDQLAGQQPLQVVARRSRRRVPRRSGRRRRSCCRRR